VNLPMIDDVRTAEGNPAPWGDLFQKRNSLLLFATTGDPACDRAVEALAKAVPELEEEEAVGVVVYDRKPDKSPDGLLCLVDSHGNLAGAVGARPGRLVAVSRFFEVLKGVDAGNDPEAAVEEAIGWIDLEEISCPECGVPTW
jgi:hypothetical protein